MAVIGGLHPKELDVIRHCGRLLVLDHDVVVQALARHSRSVDDLLMVIDRSD